jgi:hypothetical protein
MDVDTVVARSVEGLPGVSLAEVVAGDALQQRVDRKYLVPADALARVLTEVAPRLRSLEIGSLRQFGYDTTYFDTPDLTCFRAHVQGRRLRAKVRARTYTDSGESAFEVKTSGHRDLTVKQRMEWSGLDDGGLTPEVREFVRAHAPFLRGPLGPAARTTYQRTTLLVHGGGRVTVDVGLRLAHGGRAAVLDPDTALVETKTKGPAGPLDRALVASGVRPLSVSKYCLAIALLQPGATSNRWHRVMRRHFGWIGSRGPVVV